MSGGTSLTALPTVPDDLSFTSAAELVLGHLRDHVPVALWSVTRVENGRQTVLLLDDAGSGATPGFSVPWESSFCVLMSSGTLPHVVPDVQAVPAYAQAARNSPIAVAAYAGAMITEPDGQFFGSLCGVDTSGRTDDAAFVSVGPLLQLLGKLLSIVLAAERRRDRDAASLLVAQLEAETDALTGLYNRRAWQRVVAREEARFRSLADPTVAVVLDLDLLKSINDSAGHHAGDDYIRTAARTLRGAVREHDVVARLGGDEFGVLMVGCSEAEATRVVARIYDAFEAAGVAGSIGWAPMTVLKGFPAALAEADAAMYAAKAERRRLRTAAISPQT